MTITESQKPKVHSTSESIGGGRGTERKKRGDNESGYRLFIESMIIPVNSV
jgi:hypothetical protein